MIISNTTLIAMKIICNCARSSFNGLWLSCLNMVEHGDMLVEITQPFGSWRGG